MSGTLITEAGYAKILDELERLEGERETLVERMRQALEHARAFPENDGYLDTRHELELVDRRIAELEQRLRDAEVASAERDGVLDVGERVTVLDRESRETAAYRVVGDSEADPAVGDISHRSPIGAALLGRREGDVVEVDVPGGRLSLEIVEVDG